MFYEAIFDEGNKRLDERFDEFFAVNPDCSETEDELVDELAEDAYENDGYTRMGRLTPEEMYCLLYMYHDLETANEYLEEIEYFEIEAVA